MIGIYVKTKYTLLLSLVYFYKSKKEIVYFIEEEIARELNFSDYNIVLLKDFSKNKNLKNKYLKWKFNNELLKKIKNIEKIYLQDHISYGQFFLNNFGGDIYLLEDGILNYNEKTLENELKRELKGIKINNFVKKIIIEKRKKEYRKYGLSDKVKKIYLTGLLPVPNIIKNKVEIINVIDLYTKLDKDSRKKILKVFNLNDENIVRLKKSEENILLLTQPLSEDNIVTENEKIEIYKEIIKKEIGKSIYIKTHPREETNYKEIFKEFNIKVIKKDFPIELLLISNIKFNKIITLFSTGALNLKKITEEIEFIGTKKYSKLYEKLGEIKI